jgi:hypothetical protein
VWRPLVEGNERRIAIGKLRGRFAVQRDAADGRPVGLMNGDGGRATGGVIVQRRGDKKATQAERNKWDRREEEVGED